jgi:predicted porin
MKKTLIALAAVAATGAAFAQSSVTISGRIDLGHANLKTTNTTGGVTTSTVKGAQLSGDEQGRTTSRLTFSGVEDLGGGLKASFNYETRLSPDSTAASGMDRTRNMFLNLSGGFGGVTIGTYLNSVDTLRGISAATYSAPGGDFLADHGGLSGRSTNALGYRSPSFGGLVISAGVTNQDATTANNAGLVTTQAKSAGNLFAATYNLGPVSVHGVVANGKGTGVAAGITTTTKQFTNGLSLSYDLGMAKPYFALETGKTTPSTAVANTNSKYSAWELGSTFPMGAFTPYVIYGNGKIKGNTVGVATASNKTSAFQVGSTYALSKRTYVYGAVGQQKNTQNLASIATANRTAVKESGYKLGLVHSF